MIRSRGVFFVGIRISEQDEAGQSRVEYRVEQGARGETCDYQSIRNHRTSNKEERTGTDTSLSWHIAPEYVCL